MRTQQFSQSHEGFQYSAGHNHAKGLDSAALVGVVGISNAPSLGRLSLVKTTFDHDLPATLTSPQRPWRCHDNFLYIGWQQPRLIWDVRGHSHRPCPSKNHSGAPIRKSHTNPKPLLLFARSFLTQVELEPLWGYEREKAVWIGGLHIRSQQKK